METKDPADHKTVEVALDLLNNLLERIERVEMELNELQSELQYHLHPEPY